MKLYINLLKITMKRKNFFILAMLVLGIGLLIWTFFGWSSNTENNDILQDETPWFTDTLSDTWSSPDSWYTQIDISDTSQKNGYTEIKLMMPKYFYNAGRKNFAEDLYKNRKIYIKFIFIDDLYSYRQQLYNKDFSEADLFLFPYDRLNKIPAKLFSPNGTESYFDKLIHPLLSNSEISFLPFSADPMIMYAVSWYTSTNSFYEISEFIFKREPVRALAFPLFFGINTEDATKKWFSREYQDIVRYALMHYFQTNNDSHDLQIRVESNVLQKYNIQNLQTISNIITAPECKYFPSICFQLYNFVWIRFWFLSDADIVNLYLQNKKSDFSSIQKLTLPFSQLESPIRIRWRWMPSSLEDEKIINWVYTFFVEYIQQHTKYNLRNSTLSVFKSEGWNWLLDNPYIWLRWYILQDWWDYLNTLRGINKFWDLIEYKITAKEYLK